MIDEEKNKGDDIYKAVKTGINSHALRSHASSQEKSAAGSNLSKERILWNLMEFYHLHNRCCFIYLYIIDYIISFFATLFHLLQKDHLLLYCLCNYPLLFF